MTWSMRHICCAYVSAETPTDDVHAAHLTSEHFRCCNSIWSSSVCNVGLDAVLAEPLNVQHPDSNEHPQALVLRRCIPPLTCRAWAIGSILYRSAILYCSQYIQIRSVDFQGQSGRSSIVNEENSMKDYSGEILKWGWDMRARMR